MNFSAMIASALIENRNTTIAPEDLRSLLSYDPRHLRFIQQTFDGIFFTGDDLRFLDQVSWQVQRLEDPFKKAIAISALVRSSIKRQPRGVFTVAGDPEHLRQQRSSGPPGLIEANSDMRTSELTVQLGAFPMRRCT
jgi:DNA adenine methylase/adenine-specific DNA-methyltransferase